MSTRINHPTAPANPPQHMETYERVPAGLPLRNAHRRTGAGTAPPGLDVADPHPPDEGHPEREFRPGGANPPSDVPIGSDEIGPNPARHTGTPPPRPHNAGSGPK
ncbi:MAG TPA: hypothetical protein VG757_03990 [Devosia sp.]|nr:hypothetical protein [Devosia sp.]